jgi:inositol-pentakisphosphate 2-kinase
MVLDVTQTSPADWHYISEGGASIVFSYRGPPNPAFSDKVLRLRKSSRERQLKYDNIPNHNSSGEAAAEGHRSQSQSTGPEPNEVLDLDSAEDRSISFQQTVSARLIEPAFLPRLETITVEQQWLEVLSTESEGARPAERQRKDGIDTRRTNAVLATDLVGYQGLAVEIKVRV